MASMTTSQKKRAKFIFVPAHLNEPLEEWEVEYTEEQAVECLLDKVKVRKIYEMRERERERDVNVECIALVAARR